jgi:predicted DCC family thiol-disulfide oxidoreductase YuxK
VKVYFNNSCNICRAEINLYKKQNIENIEWIDITDNKSAQIETQKNDKTLLRRLHIKDGEKVIGGAEAFLLVWKKIPKYKFLYTFFKIPIIFTLFSYFYEIIAFFLYLKNKKQLSKKKITYCGKTLIKLYFYYET